MQWLALLLALFINIWVVFDLGDTFTNTPVADPTIAGDSMRIAGYFHNVLSVLLVFGKARHEIRKGQRPTETETEIGY